MKPTESDLFAAYQYLSALKPFSAWNLPSSQSVEFEVNRSQMLQGEYSPDPHTIKVSAEHCKTQIAVLETVAHEMVHLALEQSGGYGHLNHDEDFLKHAKAVCKAFGWKTKGF